MLGIHEKLQDRGWEGYLPWEPKLFADEFHERIPIFWRPELFELLESGQLLLSSWTEEELAEVHILENRYGSFVRLSIRGTEETLWFYTLHLQHETSRADARELELAREKRAQAERTIAKHIQDHVGSEETVILGGDFNTVAPLLLPSEIAGLRKSDPCWQGNGSVA